MSTDQFHASLLSAVLARDLLDQRAELGESVTTDELRQAEEEIRRAELALVRARVAA